MRTAVRALRAGGRSEELWAKRPWWAGEEEGVRQLCTSKRNVVMMSDERHLLRLRRIMAPVGHARGCNATK